MAQTPVEFMNQHNILKGNKEIDQERANKVFIDQLGPVWRGASSLNSIERAIFGLLAAYAVYDRKSAEDAYKELADVGINNLFFRNYSIHFFYYCFYFFFVFGAVANLVARAFASEKARHSRYL